MLASIISVGSFMLVVFVSSLVVSVMLKMYESEVSEFFNSLTPDQVESYLYVKSVIRDVKSYPEVASEMYVTYDDGQSTLFKGDITKVDPKDLIGASCIEVSYENDIHIYSV